MEWNEWFKPGWRRALLIVTIGSVAGLSALIFRAAGLKAAAASSWQWDAYSLRPVYHPQGRFYVYAPAVIVDGATEHIWSCQNAQDGVIRDHIFYTRRVRGVVVENRAVLAASAVGTWDSFHTCDPSVVRTRIRYGGEVFHYAMLYLGNDVDASRHNQIGVAFARQVGGPWRKFPMPLVRSDEAQAWGVGQPSALSLDQHGRVLLFYTRGDHLGTRACFRELDLADVDKLVLGAERSVTTAGLTGRNGAADWLNNFDVAFDREQHRFYMVREQHPYPPSHPGYIGASLQIVSMDAAALWNGHGTWRVETSITPELTGFARNHNAGFKRSAAGTLPATNQLAVVFARSCAAGSGVECATPEWSYDLWEMTAQRLFIKP